MCAEPRRRLLALVIFVVATGVVVAVQNPEVIVWPQGAPGSTGQTTAPSVRITDQGERVVTNVHQPSFTVYAPASGRATGAAVLVLPGGGHRELWTDHEGHAVARWMQERGVAAFVLLYRLARAEGSTYSIEDHALADVQRALQIIRQRAAEWQVDPARVGVMGFSAGGQLAALAALRGAAGEAESPDPVARESSRPAFQALIYPGRTADILPGPGAPPAFLVCGENDRPDIALGLAQAYIRFREAGVSAELHVFSGAGHGFGQRASNSGAASRWLERWSEWMQDRGLLDR